MSDSDEDFVGTSPGEFKEVNSTPEELFADGGSANDMQQLDNAAYPGGYEVVFDRSLKNGRKMHTVQVRYGTATIGASGENLADAFRALADRLEDELGGGPYASVVWGSYDPRTQCEVCGETTANPVLTADSHPIGPNQWVCGECDE